MLKKVNKTGRFDVLDGLVLYSILSTVERKKMRKIKTMQEKKVGHSHVGLNSALGSIRAQIEIECFDDGDLEEAERIALIIAEVMTLPDTVTIQIGKDKIPGELVKSVYSLLDHEHVCTVIEQYRKITYPIRHIKSYLRTVLYNEVFESDFRTENEFRRRKW